MGYFPLSSGSFNMAIYIAHNLVDEHAKVGAVKAGNCTKYT